MTKNIVDFMRVCIVMFCFDLGFSPESLSCQFSTHNRNNNEKKNTQSTSEVGKKSKHMTFLYVCCVAVLVSISLSRGVAVAVAAERMTAHSMCVAQFYTYCALLIRSIQCNHFATSTQSMLMLLPFYSNFDGFFSFSSPHFPLNLGLICCVKSVSNHHQIGNIFLRLSPLNMQIAITDALLATRTERKNCRPIANK